VEEGRRQSSDQQTEDDQAAIGVKGSPLGREQISEGIDLARVQGQEESLTGTDQGREQDDGKGGVHGGLR
jgi:hypothetical protein